MNNTCDDRLLEKFLEIEGEDLTTEKMSKVAAAYESRFDTIEKITKDGSVNALCAFSNGPAIQSTNQRKPFSFISNHFAHFGS